MKSLKSLRKKYLYNKKVLLRTDFNVPGLKIDEPRIKKTIPILRYLSGSGARVILLSHCETNDKKTPSLKPLASRLKRSYLPRLEFSSDICGASAKKAIGSMKSGDILMLENLRKDRGEVSRSPVFARKLASLGDLFVNEAFSVSHREHASIVLLPRLLPSFSGFLFDLEIKNLSRVSRPKRPFVLILGGGKVETKMPLLLALHKKADKVLLGGVIANIFLQDKKYSRKAKKIRNIVLPVDVIVQDHGRDVIKDVGKVGLKERIFDVGPKTLKFWQPFVKSSRLIVWNGPLGFMEKGYRKSTEKLVLYLKNARAEVIIGGGDSADFLPGRMPENVFVSTGGGAMLDFLSEGTLPGIKALRK